MQPTHLAIIGAVLAGAAVIGSASDWEKSKSRRRKWLLVAVTAALINVAASIWAGNQSEAKASELIAAQRENLRLSRELQSFSQGSDGFGYFDATVSSPKHSAIGALIHTGKYPLYDVRIQIVPDPDRRLPVVNGRATYDILEEMMRLDREFAVGTLNPSNAPGFAYPSLKVPFELGQSEQRRAYNIFVSSRNDYTLQKLRFARVGDRWFVAYRVSRQLGGNEGPVLKEFIQPGYPQNAGGQIEW